MSHERDAASSGGGDASAASGGAAAGKRALTDRLAQRATNKNPAMQVRLGFEPSKLSSAPVASEEFARDVADKQQERGLHVDGVAGKKTVHALLGEAFDFTDHAPPGKGGKAGKKAKGPPAKGQPLQLAAALATNSLADEHACVAMIGADDGVTPEATFQITYGNGHPVPDLETTIASIARATTTLRARRGRLVFPPDAGVLVTLPPPPALEEEDAPGGGAPNADGSFGDDHDHRLEA